MKSARNTFTLLLSLAYFTLLFVITTRSSVMDSTATGVVLLTDALVLGCIALAWILA